MTDRVLLFFFLIPAFFPFSSVAAEPKPVRMVDCFMQDALAGDALQYVERKEIKRLRIVAVGEVDESKDAKTKHPISLGGTEKPLTVLGEVPVEEDGSAWFAIPSEKPVFFQLLDENGRAIQTMRKSIILSPDEPVSCMGCHSEGNCKLVGERSKDRLALTKSKKPAKPKPLVDPKIPFRYVKTIQPIWDRHCVSCHTGEVMDDGPPEPLASFLSYPLRHEKSGKVFSESYLTLIDREEVPLVDWIGPTTKPAIKRAYSFGSARSELMIHLDPEHYEVLLSDEEKRLIECWIDIGIPF